jgi:hypothetical protein
MEDIHEEIRRVLLERENFYRQQAIEMLDSRPVYNFGMKTVRELNEERKTK